MGWGWSGSTFRRRGLSFNILSVTEWKDENKKYRIAAPAGATVVASPTTGAASGAAVVAINVLYSCYSKTKKIREEKSLPGSS